MSEEKAREVGGGHEGGPAGLLGSDELQVREQLFALVGREVEVEAWEDALEGCHGVTLGPSERDVSRETSRVFPLLPRRAASK